MLPSEVGSYLRLLEESGWTYEEQQTAGGLTWWRVRSRPPQPACELLAVLSQGCLVLEVPLAVQPLPECREALWRYLLCVNGAVKLVKLGLDSADRLRLAAELPASACNFASFRDAVGALRTYTAHYRREIELLAANPALAEAWMSLAPRSQEPAVTILSRERET